MADAEDSSVSSLRDFDRHASDALLEDAERVPPDRAELEAVSSSYPGASWRSSARYSDRPISWGTRLFGMSGVAIIVLLILFGSLITWRIYSAPPPATTLSVFDVTPPAAAPQPPSEIPPGPEQAEKQKLLQLPERPMIEPPMLQIPGENPMPLRLSDPVTDPAPPVDETSAPEAEPAPPAPRASNGKPTWEGAVLAALNKAKRYPREAVFRRQQGVPYIRFVMDREGRVLSSRLERSSGFRALDEEAVALPKRATPFPKPPEEMADDMIELIVPVEFFMR